jgi:glucose-1-phosphate thymidylyltransferase
MLTLCRVPQDMKGIILAGGTGSRLWPITRSVSKQLLPVYDKPMIYYPLATLISAQIREVMIISTPEDRDAFYRLLGDGSELGMTLTYAIQKKPEGLAQAFTIGRSFIESDPVALILGDNIFHGQGLGGQLKSLTDPQGAVVFTYRMADPENYGVVELDDVRRAISLEEKPNKPKSNFVIHGLYFYDDSVIQIAEEISPSQRRELEITSVNEAYLLKDQLSVQKLECGTDWLDTGSAGNLSDAAQFVRVIQERQVLLIGCIHELAWRNSWLSDDQLEKLGTQWLMANMESIYFH